MDHDLFSTDEFYLSEVISSYENMISQKDRNQLIRLVVAELNRKLFPPINHMELIHTELCNLRCSYCFEKKMLSYRQMDTETAKLAIDLLFEYCGSSPLVTILHFGGEPTLNFSGIQFATEYAEKQAVQKKKMIEFSLTSNGISITDRMIDYFYAHNIKVLLSIDGLQESNDKYRIDRKGNGTFRRILNSIKRLKCKQCWIGAKMTVMPDNVLNLFSDIVGLHELGVNQFIIGYATGIEWSRSNIEYYTDQLSLVYEWYQKNRCDELRISDFDSPVDDVFFGCKAGRNSISVSVDGSISPCSKLLALNNTDIVFLLGHVQHGITFLNNRRNLVSCNNLIDNVEKIGINNTFRGGCFASNYENSRDIFIPNQQDHIFSLLQRAKCGGCVSQH